MQEDSGEADGPSSDPAVTNPESSSRTSAEDQVSHLVDPVLALHL
jgi:hypothetical protein